MKKIFKVLLVINLIILTSCSNKANNTSGFDCSKNSFKKNPIASIKIKDYGTLKFELFINKAPQSVANFVELANSKFYNGLNFHRLDSDLGIIQGGDPEGTGAGGPGYYILGEFLSNDHCNDEKNKLGTIAMARSSENDSAGSQFYINFKDNGNVLNNDYAVFGRIIEGDKILEKISKAKTIVYQGIPAPKNNILIDSITVETFNQKMPKINKIK